MLPLAVAAAAQPRRPQLEWLQAASNSMLHAAACFPKNVLRHLKLKPIDAFSSTVRSVMAKLRSLVCLSLARASAAVAWQGRNSWGDDKRFQFKRSWGHSGKTCVGFARK